MPKEERANYTLGGEGGRVVVSIVLLRGQEEELEKLVLTTGKGKSELMREALTFLINSYRDMR